MRGAPACAAEAGLPAGKHAGYELASTVPRRDMTTAKEAGARSHAGVVVSGMASSPVPSGCACPGVVETLAKPSWALGSRPALSTMGASFAASCAAVAWASPCTCCGVSGADVLTAAAAKITSSVSSTAPAVTATKLAVILACSPQRPFMAEQ